MTRFWLAVSTGFREIISHKARSILSFSAVSVGAASLLYTLAMVHGMQSDVAKAVELMGPGRLRIEEKRSYKSRGLSEGLTSDDAEDIRAIPGMFMTYPKTNGWGIDVRYKGQRFENVQVVGTTQDWAKRDWVFKLRGRFLSAADVRETARVCVVVEPGGWEEKPFWASFFGRQRPFPAMVERRELLGRELQLNGHGFTIIGVLREPARDRDPRWIRDWSTMSGLILVPVSAHHQHLRPAWRQRSPHGVRAIEVDTGDDKTVPEVKRAIERILKRRHREEPDYEIHDNREAIENKVKETKDIVLVGIFLGSIAILAGGIGIMNVTLATIFLRVKEIGIRRALGASRADIVGQFVAEATLLGMLGGLAGLGLGSAGIEHLAKEANSRLAEPVWWHFLAAFSVATATGFFFSLVPAWRASGLDPVEALLNE